MSDPQAIAMRVLVTAASRHRGTFEIAEAIASGLTERGIASVAVPVEQATTLHGYSAVVLGSGIYTGRWLGEARRFAQIHASELCVMPVWLFSSGPVGPVDHPIPPGTPADVPVLIRLTRAIGHRTFGGRLDMRHLHFAERAVARTIHAPEGDSRDWDAVDRFAGEIADELFGAHMAA
jgi:menaquinone-dependent protoporphyrinogen oxidase